MINYLKNCALAYGVEESQIAVQCPTVDEASKYLLMLKEQGKAWSPSSDIIGNNGKPKTKWGKNKELTSYRVNEMDDRFIKNGNADFYRSKGNIIVTFEELKQYISPDMAKRTKEEINEVPGIEPDEPVNNIPDEIEEDFSSVNDSEKKHCPYCDALLDKEAVFCFECGKKVKEDEIQTEPIYHETGDKPNICNCLKVEVNQPFVVDTDKLQGRKFRINESGLREELIAPNFWIMTSDEVELAYIISNLHQVRKE